MSLIIFCSLKLDHEGCYYLKCIFSMKSEVFICNISMEWNIYRLHDGIKAIRLHSSINHNTNLNEQWLRIL